MEKNKAKLPLYAKHIKSLYVFKIYTFKNSSTKFERNVEIILKFLR